MTLPEAVLWDMDGTLVDTEPYWIACEFAIAERWGGTWTEAHAHAVLGGALTESTAYMAEHMGIDRTPAQILEELLDRVVAMVEQEIPWRPGARDLLLALRDAGVPRALVTASWRRFVEPILAALPPASFDVVVCGDEVEHGKPHPEPYLRAAELIGVDPARAVAIEDSPTGAAAAEAAGCQVLVVPSQVPVPPGPRRVEHLTLVGVGPHDLTDLLSPLRA